MGKLPPFWRRGCPAPEFDVVKLRPPVLSKGRRFETKSDVLGYSALSQSLLRKRDPYSVEAEYLQDCANGDYECFKPCCPLCARHYRRWFIGELLQLYQPSPTTFVVTALLEASEEISSLDPHPFTRKIRSWIASAGLGGEMIVGAFEIAWRARDKKWVLHCNLVVPNATKKQCLKLIGSKQSSDTYRPVVSLELADRAEQLSYVPKFTTYHRPYKQRGSKKSPAKSLNPREHSALVAWMSGFTFTDFMFLHGARRVGTHIRKS